MNINLTQKERSMLEDQKTHEQVCIQKYSNYANATSCSQLKNIFNNNGKIEQEHLNTINQLLSGQVPAMNNQQGGGQQQGAQQGGGQQQQGQQQNKQFSNMQQKNQQSNNMQQQMSNISNSMSFQNSAGNNSSQDKELCQDMLMTEKFVSGAYDTAIFEFRDPQVRNVLNHIQKEEQQHGESIYNYMESKGMYQAK